MVTLQDINPRDSVRIVTVTRYRSSSAANNTTKVSNRFVRFFKKVNNIFIKQNADLNKRELFGTVNYVDIENKSISIFPEFRDGSNNYQLEIPFQDIKSLSKLVPREEGITEERENLLRRKQGRLTNLYRPYVSPRFIYTPVELIEGGNIMVIAFQYQLSTTGTTFTVPVVEGLLSTDSYTVTYSFEIVGGSTTQLVINNKTLTSFDITTVDGSQLNSGDLLDFQLKEY